MFILCIQNDKKLIIIVFSYKETKHVGMSVCVAFGCRHACKARGKKLAPLRL